MNNLEELIVKDLYYIGNIHVERIYFHLPCVDEIAVIVPDGVLFGSSNAHKSLREEIVENHQLHGVISMPSGVFKPYAGVSTAVLMFRKTGAGGTDKVCFYDMQAEI